MDANARPQIDPAPAVSTGSIESFDGTRIVFDLYDADSEIIAIVVPGFWRDRSYQTMRNLGAFLVSQGYRAAIIDSRGHGDSGGRYGFNLHEAEDTAAVARHLLSMTGAATIVLIGFSVGGAIAISTAARHPDLPVSGLLLISSVAVFSMIAPRIGPLAIRRHIALRQALRRPRFEWRFTTSRKLNAAEDIRNVHARVCLVHVKNDWLIDHRHSLLLYERANEPKELHLIDMEGNFHADRIFVMASDQIEPVVIRFLRSVRASLTAR